MRHGAEPWTALAIKLMRKYPNLYYMTSAFAPKYYPAAVIDHMREEFDAPQMRFVIGRVKDHYGKKNGGAKLVRDAQQKVAETTDGVEWFDTDGYTLFNAGHYDGPGLIEMGKDFAKALGKGE